MPASPVPLPHFECSETVFAKLLLPQDSAFLLTYSDRPQVVSQHLLLLARFLVLHLLQGLQLSLTFDHFEIFKRCRYFGWFDHFYLLIYHVFLFSQVSPNSSHLRLILLWLAILVKSALSHLSLGLGLGSEPLFLQDEKTNFHHKSSCISTLALLLCFSLSSLDAIVPRSNQIHHDISVDYPIFSDLQSRDDQSLFRRWTVSLEKMSEGLSKGQRLDLLHVVSSFSSRQAFSLGLGLFSFVFR